MIKLLALDMDGTLLTEDKKLTQPQIDAIHKAVEAGVKLVLCTGRILNGVKPYFNQLGLDAENEYVIVNNGCSTHQTSDWTLIDYAELSPEEVDYLSGFVAGSNLQLTLFDEEDYFVYGEEASDIVREDTKVVFVEPVTLTHERATDGSRHLFQAMFVGPEADCDRFEAAHKSTLDQRFNSVRSQKTIFEILPQDVSKASALKALAERLDIDPSEVMAIGDANNDIEMLEFAGLAIAMGNADDHIKTLADDTTASNNEDGVAKAIEKWILNN